MGEAAGGGGAAAPVADAVKVPTTTAAPVEADDDGEDFPLLGPLVFHRLEYFPRLRFRYFLMLTLLNVRFGTCLITNSMN